MNLQRLRSVLGKGTQHLGDIVFWQLADARVARSTLESLWRDAGLDAALLPEEPTAERALKQAVREAQVGQRDRLIRLGLDSEAEVIFAIVRESHDDAGNVTYVQEARVRLDRTSEAINSDVTSHDIVQAVFAGFRTLRTTHTADDVRRAIVNAPGTWAAVTLHDGGGIYWVPAVYAAELRRLQGAVEKIGGLPGPCPARAREQNASRALGAIATASLEAELAQLQAEIAAFVSMPPERTSTLTRRLEAFAEVSPARAAGYRSHQALESIAMRIAIDVNERAFLHPKTREDIEREVAEAASIYWLARRDIEQVQTCSVARPSQRNLVDILLSAPAVGDDADFERVRDLGRPGIEWDT